MGRLLAQAPGLQFLATARIPLNTPEEWLVPLEGLDVPARAASTRDGDESESVRLFLLAAQRSTGNFQLTEANRQAVYAICRHVAGLPLAIELAAAWLRGISCQEIARRLTSDLSLLVSPYASGASRHASITTLFEHSWRLLSLKEQRILAQAALAPGSFTAEALEVQVDATPFDLVGFVAQTLLRLLDNGRYQMHTLVRQFALERLSADNSQREAAIAAYCEYYADWVERQAAVLEQNGEHQATLALLSSEVENIQAVWGFLLARFSRESAWAIARLAIGTRRLYERIGWFAEGMRLFRQLRAHLNAFPDSFRQENNWIRAYSRVMGQTAIFFWYQNQLSAAHLALEDALVVLKPGSEWNPERHLALRHLGIIAWQSGQLVEARTYAAQALAALPNRGLDAAKTNALRGLIDCSEGMYTEAEWILARAVYDLEMYGELRYRSYALDGLMRAQIAQGKLDPARQRIGEMQVIGGEFRAMNDRWGVAAILLRLGRLLIQLGEQQAAEDTLREAASIAGRLRILALERDIQKAWDQARGHRRRQAAW